MPRAFKEPKKRPIAQNIQETFLKQLKKLENFNIQFSIRFAF